MSNKQPSSKNTNPEKAGTPHSNLLNYFLPNLITILAICAGVTSIRLAFEAHFEKAILMVLIAGILDGFDGRIARILGSSSSFGAQMDSLADNVNFGVAPALIAYVYLLNQTPRLGWVVVLVYCIACCLRLARFNVMLEDKNMPAWKKDYFVGIPAPAGALLALLPVYLGELGMPVESTSSFIFCAYLLMIAYLLISRLPIWNAKNINPKHRKNYAIPFILCLVALIGFTFTYTWQTLSLASFVYLLFIPISIRSYQKKAKAMESNS